MEYNQGLKLGTRQYVTKLTDGETQLEDVGGNILTQVRVFPRVGRHFKQSSAFSGQRPIIVHKKCHKFREVQEFDWSRTS